MVIVEKGGEGGSSADWRYLSGQAENTTWKDVVDQSKDGMSKSHLSTQLSLSRTSASQRNTRGCGIGGHSAEFTLTQTGGVLGPSRADSTRRQGQTEVQRRNDETKGVDETDGNAPPANCVVIFT